MINFDLIIMIINNVVMPIKSISFRLLTDRVCAICAPLNCGLEWPFLLFLLLILTELTMRLF